MTSNAKTVGLMTALIATILVGLGEEKKPVVQITLHEKASVVTNTVRLIDIATLTPLAETSRQSLSELSLLPITQAPLPNYSRNITKGEIMTKLAKAGWKEKSYILDGAKSVVINRSGKPITATDLEMTLQKALNSPVKVLFPPPPLLLPEGDLNVEVDTSIPKSGRVMMPIKISVNGQFITTVKVLAQISRKSDPTSPKTSFKSDKTNFKSDQITSVVSQRKEFAVRRRQQVRLIAHAGKILVTAQGIAWQDGHIGEEILVSVAWSKKPLKGQVTGQREVSIFSW